MLGAVGQESFYLLYFLNTFAGMHTPAIDGTYTGKNSYQSNNIFKGGGLKSSVASFDFLFFIFYFCTGANDHLYTIFDPRADSEETWDNWNLRCLVNYHCFLNHNRWIHCRWIWITDNGRKYEDLSSLILPIV